MSEYDNTTDTAAKAAAIAAGACGSDATGSPAVPADTSAFPDIASEAFAQTLTRYRRDLHRIPETDFDLPETLTYVRSVLEGLPCQIVEPCRSTLCAFFDRGSAHATAIRADMDALPVTERSGVPFASTHPGAMHACGHDGHMTMVLGLAQHIAVHLDELPRSVLLVFQPAEETTGGAKFVCESGVFERYHVDRIFGFHLWPDLPKGQIASKPGALLAASNEATFTFHGKASHIAKASEGRDSLEAGVHFYTRAYEYMDARAQEEPCLLKFGHMVSGEVRNQISANTQVEGSLRTFSVEMGKRCRGDLSRMAEQTAAEFGCTADVLFSEGYPPVVNDGALFDLAAPAVPGLRRLTEPLLIAEDFAWYQRHLPGVFFLLGTGTGIPLHADTFDFDEAILTRGVDTYARLIRIP
jgi:amidohydrolase